MSLPKLFNRIIFHNNTTPALNETNLNLVSKAVDDIDDRVIDIAGTVMETVPEILDKYDDIEGLATNPPYIGQNGHWWTWDTDTNQYVDSGVDAGVSVTIGTTSTLTPGSDATVTNSGTDTDPILNFGIPAGVAGQDGQDGADGADGADGVSPEVTIASITGGHSVTITDADHPSGQTFNVMDGTNGQGVPSGGTTGQVLKKASGTDYDTEWANASGGSGGHTILNGSGSAMSQRGKLQFVGGNVKDDSTNDKTVFTVARELTQAEYDALSSAEKNNGTTYYVPDAYSSYTGVPRSMICDTWNGATAYEIGDHCIYGDKLYWAKLAGTNKNPSTQTSYWEETKVIKSKNVELLSSAVSLPFELVESATSGQTEINLTDSMLKYKEIIVTVTQKEGNFVAWQITGVWTRKMIENSITYRSSANYAGTLPVGMSLFNTSGVINYGYWGFFQAINDKKIKLKSSHTNGWQYTNSSISLTSILGCV